MKRFRSFLSTSALVALLSAALGPARPTFSAPASSHHSIDCTKTAFLCAEVHDSEAVFGDGVYVGHDEPSVLFYSDVPGSGNRMSYQLTLPKDPAPVPTNTFNFQLHPAFWVGMAMCDPQSFPEQLPTCTPDSDTNIVADQSKAPGHGFMEMQFYPPGWAPWPAGNSCDATKWCAALNIDSLAEDPVNGTVLNPTCQSIAGFEYVNFAFLTKSGVPQPNSPPNPVTSTLQTFTPDPNADLFMNSGDRLTVELHDTAHGLKITVHDHTTGGTGSMTASAANGFGAPRYAPTGNSCDLVLEDFHPLYSTTSEKTRVLWAAHSYNIAFADEIGHFDLCSSVDTTTGRCKASATEGSAGDVEPSDTDDRFCFPASASTLVRISGCQATNTGFDGVPYQRAWPDGNPHHPTAIRFSSPLTGEDFDQNYERMAFETDLPRIEAADFGGNCNRDTGAGCTRIPITDDGKPATFYPFFSTQQQRGQCVWALGDTIPGVTTRDFGKNAQYGDLLFLEYLTTGGHGATFFRTNDYRQVISNPCKFSQESQNGGGGGADDGQP